VLSQGVRPKVVSDLLGHGQIEITLDPYSHVTARLQAVTAAAISDLRLLAVVCAGFGRQIAIGSPGRMRRSCSIDRKGRAGRGPRWLGRVGRGSASVPTCGTAHPHQPPELELGELPELIVTWAARLAGTEDALLWLVESEQRQRLLVRCGTGRYAASAGRSLHCGEGLAGRAWQTGAPRAVADYQRWPGRLREPGSQHQLRAALCLPLAGMGTSSIAQAAVEAGFYDQAHLTRHFKRAVGITPGRYVAARRGRP
jgi:AraC-like DNA-binding protein